MSQMRDPVTEAAREELARLIHEAMEGPLGAYCSHDNTSAYRRKYECFPRDWDGGNQGERGCMVEVLAEVIAPLIRAQREDAAKCLACVEAEEIVISVRAERDAALESARTIAPIAQRTQALADLVIVAQAAERDAAIAERDTAQEQCAEAERELNAMGLELVAAREKVRGLTEVLRDIVKDATATPEDKRNWPIRAENYRRAYAALAAAGEESGK